MNWRKLQSVQAWPKKSGKADYIKFLNGETLSRSAAIRAKCYECATGEDTQPCIVETCPLIGFCQWNKQRARLNHSETIEIPLIARTEHCSELPIENGAKQ